MRKIYVLTTLLYAASVQFVCANPIPDKVVHWNGSFATGSANEIDACVNRSIQVSADNSSVQTSSVKSDQSSSIWIWYTFYDCGSDEVSYGYGWVMPGEYDLVFDGASKTVTLTGDVHLWDYASGQEVIVPAHFTWTTTGTTEADTVRAVYNLGSMVVRYQSRGKTNEASFSAELGNVTLAGYGTFGLYNNMQLTLNNKK